MDRTNIRQGEMEMDHLYQQGREGSKQGEGSKTSGGGREGCRARQGGWCDFPHEAGGGRDPMRTTLNSSIV